MDEPQERQPERQEKSAIDAERTVQLVAIVFFLKALGFAVGFVIAIVRDLPLGSRILPALVTAGLIAAGVGLLKWQRWAWPIAICVLLFEATLVREILRLLIDVGLLLLLVRPQVRARFGIADQPRRRRS
jgi:hypothetical protein